MKPAIRVQLRLLAAAALAVPMMAAAQDAPPVINPAPTSTYHEEHVRTENGQTVEKNVKTETSSPSGSRSTTYSQKITKSDDN